MARQGSHQGAYFGLDCSPFHALSVQTRTEQGDQNRALSVFQFQKSFDDVFDEHIREVPPFSMSFHRYRTSCGKLQAAQRVVATVTEQYRPQRRFRKRRTAQFDDQVYWT